MQLMHFDNLLGVSSKVHTKSTLQVRDVIIKGDIACCCKTAQVIHDDLQSLLRCPIQSDEPRTTQTPPNHRKFVKLWAWLNC